MEAVIGENVRKFRESRGLNQKVLADYLGITREEISYYETGKRIISTDLITKIAEFFSVDEYDLYQDDEAITQTNMAFAFRADSICSEDLNAIASFKKIAMNYLKMQTFLKDDK